MVAPAPEAPAPADGAAPAPAPAPAVQLPTPPPASSPTVRSLGELGADVFPLRRIELLPPAANVRILPVGFPAAWPVARVLGLATTPGRLWVNARGWRQTNGVGGKVWVFSPAANRIDPLAGRIDQHLVTDLKARRDGVWLSLDGGVAAIDPATMVVDPFAAPQGLTSGDVLGLATAGGRLMAFSRAGVLYGLNPNGRAWSRLGDTSGHNLRRLAPWLAVGGSGDWLMVVGSDQLLSRHHAGAEFEEVRPAQWQGLPSVDPPRWTALEGDGDGGFWLGSDLGLHFLLPETGSMEHRIAPRAVTVPGGLQWQVPAGFRPTTNAVDAARVRIAEGIRDRMRTRARLARLGVETGKTLDPVTPTTRLPGGVRALRADGTFLWVAAQQGTNTGRTDLLCLHMTTRKWVARVVVPAVVTTLAVDEENVWMGCDLTTGVRSPPLLAAPRKLLLKTPPARWVPDEIPATELGQRLAALPVRERAVLAFFAGDADRVMSLLDGQQDDAEALFLMAFAHEVSGKASDPRRAELLRRLHDQFPRSPFAEATRSLLPKSEAVAVEAPPRATPPLERLFARRDLNGDGRIDASEFHEWRGPDADLKPYDANGDGALDLGEFEAVLKGGR